MRSGSVCDCEGSGELTRETGERRFHHLEAAAGESGRTLSLHLPADAAPISTVLCIYENSVSGAIGDKPFLAFFIAAAAVSLPIAFVAVPLGFTPKLFWRCPCCGHPSPYYVSARGDNLKEKECLLTMKWRHIKYAKLIFYPLIIPSVCPECKHKFFEMEQSNLNEDKHRRSKYEKGRHGCLSFQPISRIFLNFKIFI